MRKSVGTLIFLLLGASFTPAPAQSSDSYRVEEHVFNSGGVPSNGTAAASASYTLSVVSIGDGLAGSPGSASYLVAAGFPGSYAPPGEVRGLAFSDEQTLNWNAELSAGSYNLYRDSIGTLNGLAYGNCEQQGITTNTTTDSDTPVSGTGFFYLVTVRNRLHEEGTKGTDSASAERAGGACP